MTADIELLPLPRTLQHADDADLAAHVQDYARANVAHATAAKDAEIERLRAIIDNREAIIATHAADTREYQKQIMHAEARAERLAEALRDVESELGPEVPLNHDSGNAVHRALSSAMAALNQEGGNE